MKSYCFVSFQYWLSMVEELRNLTTVVLLAPSSASGTLAVSKVMLYRRRQ